MASIFFATRGIYAAVEQLKMDLMAQRYWWRRKNITKGHENFGRIEDVPICGGLRPIQLWEYYFPIESPVIPGDLKSPMIDNVNDILQGLGITGQNHYEPKFIQKYLKFLTKALKLKTIPDTTKPKYPREFHQLGISVIPIGWKKDEVRDYDFKDAGQYVQEGL